MESPASNVLRLLLVLILSLSAYIQLTVVSRTVVDSPLRADASEYFSYASNLYHHRVYSIQRTWTDIPIQTELAPDNFRPPGYPVFLTLVGNPQPTERFLLRVTYVQAVLGVISVWLVYLIARMFLGRPLALIACAVTTISPHLATASTYILTESLFLFLLLLSVYTLLSALKSQKKWLYVVTGLVWAMCSLVRSTSEFFPALLLLVALAIPTFRQYRGYALIGFATFLLALSPWFIRNHSASVNEASPSLMVKTLAHGAYPGFMYRDRLESFGFPYRFDPDDAKNSHDLPSVLNHIVGLFRNDPVRYARWYLFGKPYFFLSLRDVQSFDVLIYPTTHTPYYEDYRFAAMRWLSLVLHWPLMILGLAGIGLLILRPKWLALNGHSRLAAWIVALLILYAIAFHMIAAPFPRYAIPFRPLIYMLALLPLRAAWLAIRPPRTE